MCIRDRVSGVYVLGGNPQPDISYQIVSNHLGRYFYRTDKLLNVIANPNDTTVLGHDITDLATSDNAGTVPMKSPITMTAASALTLNISDSASGIFSKSLPFRTTPYNILYSAGDLSSVSLPVIIDAPSVYLIKSVLAQSVINAAGSSLVVGYRVGTGAATSPYNVPNIGITPYGEWSAYDNSQSLANATSSPYVYEDLQICNGRFRTAGSIAGNGYFDYRPYLRAPGGLYNPYNYSALGGEIKYRWATFKWQVASTTDSNNYTQLYFTIQNSSTVYYRGSTYRLFADVALTKQILFFYRFEQSNQQTPDNMSDTNYKTTVWVDALSNFDSGTFANKMGLNTYNGLLGGYNSTYGSETFSTNNYQYKCIMPAITPNNVKYPGTTTVYPVYIYARIGVPMDATFSMEGVSCKITV